MKRLLLSLAALLLTHSAFADYIGDFAPGTTAICGQFTTYNPSTGAPATLAGTPALAVYKIGDGTNSTTESTTGLTHAEDVDTRTGMNRVCIDTSADGTFYSAGGQFSVVITTGTVNSVSVVGSEVKSFSLNKANSVKSALQTGATPALGVIDAGTAQAVTGTTLQLRSAANFDADSEIVGATCVITGGTTGVGQSRRVTAYTNATDTATVPTWTTTPTGTITYACFGTPADTFSTDSIDANALKADAATEIATALQTQALNTGTAGSVGERIGRIPNVAAGGNGGLPTVDANNAVKLQSGTGANQISLTSGAVLLQATQTGVTIPTVTNLTNAPTAGDFTATMKTSLNTAVASTQGLLTGTCSSGSTTTCVDAALTQANATQLQDRLICFSDAWCGLITTFNPATDTVTTTKTAPSTRASLTYTIFPSTTQ